MGLVSQFTAEAQQNSNEDNMSNLNQLKGLQAQMHEALHLAGRSGQQEAADESTPFASDEAAPGMPPALQAGVRGGDQSQKDVIAEIDQ